MKKLTLALTLMLLTGFTVATEQPEPPEEDTTQPPEEQTDRIPDVGIPELPELPAQAAVSDVFDTTTDTVNNLVNGITNLLGQETQTETYDEENQEQ